MPAAARLRRKVRAGIDLCGGIDGAAATVERGRSVVGDWHNLNGRAFPPLDCALALDEIAVARGQVPPIVSALAQALGGVFVPHVDACADEGTLPGEVMALAKEFGELSGAVSAGLADGEFSEADAEAALGQLFDVEQVTARLKLMLERIAEAAPVVRLAGWRGGKV